MTPEVFAQILPHIAPFGPVVVVVVLLIFSEYRSKGNQQVISEQIKDKELQRVHLEKYEEMLREHYVIITRLLSALERIEKKLDR